MRTADQLDAALDDIRAAPRDTGTLVLIVARPTPGERDVLDIAQLDTVVGLVGDSWWTRKSTKTHDGSPYPDAQVTLTNLRAIRAVADEADWPLAGDNLYVDFDLSEANLPAGARLAIGGAILEVTPAPHTGCVKFSARFGSDALRWTNTPIGRALKLRGIHARVLQSGAIRRGDPVTKV